MEEQKQHMGMPPTGMTYDPRTGMPGQARMLSGGVLMQNGAPGKPAPTMYSSGQYPTAHLPPHLQHVHQHLHYPAMQGQPGKQEEQNQSA
jgi:hypothetical protein